MSENAENTPVAIGEIEQGPSKFELFLEKNQKSIVFGAIALVALIAIYIVAAGVSKNQKLAASAALQDADSAADYKEVYENHAGTAAAGSALVIYADLLSKEDDQAGAVSALETFLDEYPEHAAYHAVVAKLAGKKINAGEYEQASSLLAEARELEGSTFNLFGNILSAEIKSLQGDQVSAESTLEELISLPPSEIGRFVNLVQSRNIVVKAEMPETVVIEKEEPAGTESADAADKEEANKSEVISVKEIVEQSVENAEE